ncbi:hypothetical protein F5I97DRAFT_1935518 [Phlebopus sp. FC_14]|nr:hypothetical protein F5I97DRAFT_1935518 [Phlebopus sp. FC_14]
MSVVKLPLIGISTLALHVACTPPHQPSDTEIVHQTPYERLFGLALKNANRSWKALYWFAAATEMASILARKIDPSLIPHALEGVVKALTTPRETPVTPAFVLGSVLVTFGGLLRWQCYRTLGRHFTFILSLRKGHQLVTSGPYAHIRHPSYTAHCHSDSFLRSSGILNVPGVRPLVFAWVMVIVVVNLGTFQRMHMEDEMLKAAFGDEWQWWASRVKYMLIPGVY